MAVNKGDNKVRNVRAGGQVRVGHMEDIKKTKNAMDRFGQKHKT